jgi:hypothetical protein
MLSVFPSDVLVDRAREQDARVARHGVGPPESARVHRLGRGQHMNLNILTHSARKVLTGVAIAAVALTIGSGIGIARTSHHHNAVSQATKEWKPRAATTTTDVVVATKEWKSATPSTKEW